jgi:hypothetical protein
MSHTKRSAIHSVYECLLILCFQVYVKHHLSRPICRGKKRWLRQLERPFGDGGECVGDGNVETKFWLTPVALTSLTN